MSTKKRITLAEVRDALKSESGVAVGCTDGLDELCRKAIAELQQKYTIVCEQLTREQLSETIRQALACGDIQRLVKHPPKLGEITQQVIYIPFAREQALMARIRRLEEILKEHGIEVLGPGEYEFV